MVGFMRLLWDLDGTIFDTYPAIVDSFIDLHKEIHGEETDKGEALRWLKKTSKDALNHYGMSEHIQRFKDLRSEEHTSELQSRFDLVCRLLLEKKKNNRCAKAM